MPGAVERYLTEQRTPEQQSIFDQSKNRMMRSLQDRFQLEEVRNHVDATRGDTLWNRQDAHLWTQRLVESAKQRIPEGKTPEQSLKREGAKAGIRQFEQAQTLNVQRFPVSHEPQREQNQSSPIAYQQALQKSKTRIPSQERER